MNISLKPIDEQVVVIVGANSGIGRETAQRFVQEGARVVLSGRSGEALEALANEIRARGGEALAVEADVTDFEQMRSLADRAVERFGRIDTWVHLAGISLYARFADTKPEEFKQIIDTNLTGQAYGAMAALPHLKRAGRGALIHVSSVEAKRALPLQSAYAASKHGIPGFLDALRLELEEDGIPISVTNIMPSGINTPLFDKALTRLGVKPRPVPPVYEPSVVADVILYAAEHPVRDLWAGGAGKSFGLLQRLSPKLADKTTRQIGFAGQRSSTIKPETAPSNLFGHLPGYNQIRGTFSSEARESSTYTPVQTNPVVKWGMAALALAAGAWFSGMIVRSMKTESTTERIGRDVRRSKESLVDRVCDRRSSRSMAARLKKNKSAIVNRVRGKRGTPLADNLRVRGNQILDAVCERIA